jgi:hypothetical protein
LPFLDSARLADLAVRHADAYQAAKPFPHVVLDDFLLASSIDQLISEFPGAVLLGRRTASTAGWRHARGTCRLQLA